MPSRGQLLPVHLPPAATRADQRRRCHGNFTWAISNLYRNGNGIIKAELERAYHDARRRPAHLKNFKDVATEHVNGQKVYMGDVHGVARSFARSHVVAPGNDKYLQSFAQYQLNKGRK